MNSSEQLEHSRATTSHPIDPGVRIGHVHLKVADLDRSLRFYCGVLGFELTQTRNGAAFVSAGGYHHHIAINTWESSGGSLGLGILCRSPGGRMAKGPRSDAAGNRRRHATRLGARDAPGGAAGLGAHARERDLGRRLLCQSLADPRPPARRRRSAPRALPQRGIWLEAMSGAVEGADRRMLQAAIPAIRVLSSHSRRAAASSCASRDGVLGAHSK